MPSKAGPLPVNPCEGCDIIYPIFTEYISCKKNDRRCRSWADYASQLTALEKYTEWLIDDMRQYQTTAETQTILNNLEFLLKKIKEAKG